MRANKVNVEKNKMEIPPVISGEGAGRIKYIFGAGLAFGISVIVAGANASNDFGVILGAGLIFGIPLFAFFGPMHFLFQFLVQRLVARLWRPLKPDEALIILNIPALIVLVAVFVAAVVPPSPASLRKSLAEHFNGTVPGSAKVTGFEKLNSLNESHCFFVFSISPGDLQAWLTNSGFVLDDPPQEETNSDFFLNDASRNTKRVDWYNEKAKSLSKGIANIDPPLTIYHFRTNQGTSLLEKELVIGSNKMDVLFFEDFH